MTPAHVHVPAGSAPAGPLPGDARRRLATIEQERTTMTTTTDPAPDWRPGSVEALTPFYEGRLRLHVAQGQRFDRDAPVVRAHPGLFVDHDRSDDAKAQARMAFHVAMVTGKPIDGKAARR